MDIRISGHQMDTGSALQEHASDRLSAVGKGSAELLNAERPEAPENRRVTIVTTR